MFLFIWKHFYYSGGRDRWKLCEFETSMIYRVSSRTAKGFLKSIFSKKKKKSNQNQPINNNKNPIFVIALITINFLIKI